MSSTTIDRINGINSGVAIKAPCRVATTANITLSGEQTIDGVAVVADDRVLVRSQTSGVNNGIYVASTSAWSRASDFDGNNDVVTGTIVSVTSGTTYGSSIWEVTTTGTITPDTTSIAFTQRVADLTGSSVSAFMATVLDDTTAAAARTTLGVTLANLGAAASGANTDITSLAGTTTNDSAASGKIGEIITNSASGVSMTTTTAKDVTSISLTAGDWDVNGTVVFKPAGTTVVTACIGYISTTSNTLPSPPNSGGYNGLYLPFTTGADPCAVLPTGTIRISVASTTTVYLGGYSIFTTSTLTTSGYIRARRVR